MAQNIVVRLRVLIAEEYENALTFTGWLPDEKDALGMSVNGDLVFIWFDDRLFQASIFDIDSENLKSQGDPAAQNDRH